MKRFIISSGFFLGLYFWTCLGIYGQNNNRNTNSTDSSSLKKTVLELETFSILPKEIDGCGCYFYLSEKDKEEGKYICVNDFAHLAFMSVNNKLEKFVLIEFKENSDIYLYANKTFELRIEITKKEFMDTETSNIEGIIVISTKNGQKLEKTFIGFCGC